MILKYLSKFVLDILPSVAATVIGALIVTHYINPRPADRSPAAAAVSAGDRAQTDVKAVEVKTGKDKTPADASTLAKAGDETAAAKAKPAAESKSAAETRTSEPRKPQPAGREKSAEKLAKAAPVAASPETTPGADDKRDVNELARAALGRLRETESPRAAQDAKAVLQPAAAQTAAASPALPTVATPSLPPSLPPAINVSTPAVGSPPAEDESSNGFMRPVPPAEIPAMQRPLDGQARAQSGNTNVADDFVSVTKSFFRAITPH